MMLSKRGFLQLLAAFAAFGRAAFGSRGEAAVASGASRPMLAIFSDPASAATVGQHYLRRFPDEANADHLLQLLEQRLQETSDSADEGSGAWRGRPDFSGDLHIAVRRDFEEGKTVELDGWILARTEVQLCALAALDHRPSSGGVRRLG